MKKERTGKRSGPPGSSAGKAPSPAVAEAPQKPERIAKRLARAGLCSRREAEAWIAAGRVAVNGRVLQTPAVTVGPADRIEVDGKPVGGRERTRLWLYHKPAGLVTTSRDPQGRPTVFAALPAGMPRVISIGRLDINTEGLLLLTNDGGLARILELPDTGWLRRYRVRAHGRVTQDQLDNLKEGIAVDGILYGPIEASVDREQGSNIWLTLGLREGKNREVKKVLSSLGLSVNRLIRISYGPFQLGDLAPGEVREIRGRTLRDQLGARLIEMAGADFEAPLLATIPEPVKAKEATPSPTKKKQGAGRPSGKPPGPGRKPVRPKARTDRKGAETLDRLDTRPRKRSAGGARSKAKGDADRRR